MGVSKIEITKTNGYLGICAQGRNREDPKCWQRPISLALLSQPLIKDKITVFLSYDLISSLFIHSLKIVLNLHFVASNHAEQLHLLRNSNHAEQSIMMHQSGEWAHRKKPFTSFWIMDALKAKARKLQKQMDMSGAIQDRKYKLRLYKQW